jgi:hypothetical protein
LIAALAQAVDKEGLDTIEVVKLTVNGTIERCNKLKSVRLLLISTSMRYYKSAYLLPLCLEGKSFAVNKLYWYDPTPNP